MNRYVLIDREDVEERDIIANLEHRLLEQELIVKPCLLRLWSDRTSSIVAVRSSIVRFKLGFH